MIDRCNLTITRLPNYSDLPEFLAEHRVEVIASLPSFSERQTNAQRGDGVFADSIAALRRFNELGYGAEGSGLLLHLVTNPVGAFLPGSQAALEADWKRELQRRYGVAFNRLYTITNMPISRFLQFLIDSGNLEAYMDEVDHRVQSRGGRRADVPDDAVGGLGRAALRLRFQSDAGSGHGRRRSPDNLRRDARVARLPPHRRRASLLRLHGRGRLELRWGYHDVGTGGTEVTDSHGATETRRASATALRAAWIEQRPAHKPVRSQDGL